VLFEEGVDCIESTNGRKRLGSPDPMDDYILALAITRADDHVKVEMALVGDGSPVDGINGFDHFVFVVEDSNVVVEDFLDLGKEVHMD
jgi:hypothetical protein